MPRIPIHQRRVTPTRQSPQALADPGYATAEFRAMAQVGGAITNVGRLIGQMQQMASDKEIIDANVQLAEFYAERDNPDWIKENIGEGSADTRPDMPRTSIAEYADKWSNDADAKRNELHGAFKYVSRETADKWLAGAKIQKAYKSGAVVNRQYNMLRQELGVSFHRQALSQATSLGTAVTEATSTDAVDAALGAYEKVIEADGKKAYQSQATINKLQVEGLKAIGEAAQTRLETAVERGDIEDAKFSLDILQKFNLIEPAEAKKLREELPATIMLNQAQVLVLSGKYEEAATLAHKVRVLNPKHGIAKASILSSVARQRKGEHDRNALDWENRYFQQLREGAGEESRKTLIQEGLTKKFITQKQAAAYEKVEKANTSFRTQKQRIRDIQSGEKTGVVGPGDDTAILSIEAEAGRVEVVKDGDGEKDIRLVSIIDPAAFARSVKPLGYAPREVWNLISHQVGGKNAAEIGKGVLAYKYLESVMPEEAEKELGKMPVLGQMHILAVPLAKEHLSEPLLAEQMVKDRQEKLAGMEVPDSDEGLDRYVLFGSEEEQYGRQTLSEGKARTQVAQVLETALENSETVREYLGVKDWAFDDRSIGEIPPEMDRYFESVAMKQYQVNRGIGASEVDAREGALFGALETTLAKFQPMIWQNELLFRDSLGAEVTLDTGTQIVEAAVKVTGLSAAELMESTKPFYSYRHEAWILRRTDAPYDPVIVHSRFAEKVFTFTPGKGTDLKLPGEADYKPGQAVPDGADAQQYPLIERGIERVMAGESAEQVIREMGIANPTPENEEVMLGMLREERRRQAAATTLILPPAPAGEPTTEKPKLSAEREGATTEGQLQPTGSK